MTANKLVLWVIASIGLAIGLIMASYQTALAADPVIGLEKTKVWAKPQVLSKTVGEVKYGTKIKIAEKKGGWMKIETLAAPKVSGWVMKSAVESRADFAEAIGSGKALDSSYGSQDVAAAGKGWDPNVEKSHREQNPKLDYASVDAMEKINFGPDEFVADQRGPASKFQKSGKFQSKVYGGAK